MVDAPSSEFNPKACYLHYAVLSPKLNINKELTFIE